MANLRNHLGLDHLDRRDRSVLLGGARVHFHDDILSLSDLAEHRVLRTSALVEEVQETVVHSVHEELRSATVGLSRVGHGQSEGLVGVLRASRLSELILNAATGIALLGGTTVHVLVGAVGVRAASSGSAGVRVLAVGAAELHHEVGDGAVHVQAGVEARGHQVNEIGRGDGHVIEELDLKHADVGSELGNLGHLDTVCWSKAGHEQRYRS